MMLETLIRQVIAEKRSVLFEHELLDILEECGLPVPRHRFIAKENIGDPTMIEGFAGSPGVVKVVSEKIMHKSDKGGVIFLETVTDDALESAAARMLAGLEDPLRKSVRGVLLEEAIEFDAGLGQELLLGMRSSGDFGPVVTLGFGGTYVEALGSATRENQSTILFHQGLTSSERLAEKLDQALFFRWITGQVRGVKGLGKIDEIRGQLKRFVDTLEHMRLVIENAGYSVLEAEFNPLVWAGRYIPVDAFLRIGPKLKKKPPFPLVNLKNALNPKSVAVMGVSKRMNVGHIILRSMLEGGYPAQQIFLIREDGQSIDGIASYPNLTALPSVVDLLVLAVAAQAVPQIIDDVLNSNKARAVLLIPGGMGETEEGKGIEEHIVNLLSRHPNPNRPALIGNNSLGIIARPERFDSFFIPRQKLPRREDGLSNVALISQSGAFVITQVTKLDFLSPQYQISLGNQIDARLSHFVEALTDNDGLTTYALYIEGLKPLDGQRLAELIHMLTSRGKDIIIYKAGRSQLGQHATMGHTASVAGDYRIFAELLTDAGAIVASTFADFCDLVRLSATIHQRTYTGRKVGLLSNAGYEVVGMADNHKGVGYALEPALYSGACQKRIAQVLKKAKIDKLVSIKNPLDLTPMANDDVHLACMQAILEDPAVDLAIFGNVPLTSMVQSLPKGVSDSDCYDAKEGYANRTISLFQKQKKPFAIVIDAGRYYDPLAYLLQDAGVPVFRSADQATRTLGLYVENRLKRRKVAN